MKFLVRHRRYLIGLLLCTLFGFAWDEDSIETFFPLQEGRSWEYESEKIVDGKVVAKMKINDTVMRKTEIGGEKVIPIRSEETRSSGRKVTKIYYFDTDSEGVYLLGKQVLGKEKEPTIWGNQLYRIKRPIKPGFSWGIEGKDGLIESIDETVKVLAGVFHKCIKVVYHNFHSILWYAPEIGKVKAIYHYPNNNMSTVQLVSYKK